MANLVYTSCYRDSLLGNVNFASDSFKMMLVTGSYSASKNHSKRSDITNEISGTGYTSGGNTATPTVGSVNTSTNSVSVTFTVTTWTSATFTANGGVIYKARGGSASSDELVLFVDFGQALSITSGDFEVTVDSPWTLNN